MAKKKNTSAGRAKSKKSVKGLARKPFKLSDKEISKIKGGKSKKSNGGFRFVVPH